METKPFSEYMKLVSPLKRITIFCIIVLIIGTGILTYRNHQKFLEGYVKVLYLDDREVAVFSSEDKEKIEHSIEQAKNNAKSDYDLDNITIAEELCVEKEHRMDADLDDISEIENYLESTITVMVKANAIYVDDKQVAFVQDDVTSDELLDKVGEQFISKDGQVEDIEVQEEITIEETRVHPDKIMDKESAINVLIEGSKYTENYEVNEGESLWSIASNEGKTVSELRKANPQLDEKTLRPGEKIRLQKSDSYVNVEATEKRQVKESISYDTEYRTDSSMWSGETRVVEPGKAGVRVVTYRVVKENGEEKTREVLNKEVIEEPKNRVVARGTSARPGAMSNDGRFLFPIDPSEGKITSRYGKRGRGFHQGLDYGASQGTPVRAAADGKVTHSGYRGGYGNLVIISHSNGYETYYAHNSSNHVSTGEYVNQGDVVALVGSTGNSTGPHLHFEIHRNGQHTDPLNYFNTSDL
ncbi:LysM peptidoglycan-binding domain-containing M23 family metallopeptidase [Natranaerobius trueperi]|uniref:Peptidase n=1 Tax=Natranaerobius trueperi TaxID=759412 RepID=A0A226BZG4_9FIRM|nr:peptidoglycan DD-metalloendopeptidase family protein [Natranaerobius trueperi]OWZ83497.1 peptidase [Natranaerobius trueperi]